jgi:hypothetical protein
MVTHILVENKFFILFDSPFQSASNDIINSCVKLINFKFFMKNKVLTSNSTKLPVYKYCNSCAIVDPAACRLNIAFFPFVSIITTCTYHSLDCHVEKWQDSSVYNSCKCEEY